LALTKESKVSETHLNLCPIFSHWKKQKADLQKYVQLDILKKVKINFYDLPSGRSPVEDFIEGLSKKDQARFEVLNL